MEETEPFDFDYISEVPNWRESRICYCGRILISVFNQSNLGMHGRTDFVMKRRDGRQICCNIE